MVPLVAGLTDPVEIGRGGFGIVYRAHDERFDRDVAVKIIRDAGLSDEVLARFARECKSLGSLSGHPNIVSIHDAGQTEDGELYLTMEYLPRGSLAQRIATQGPASPEDVLAWGAALAGALETAHQSGIIHRDVKPENVLFSPFGAPKLVDFGIARMRTAFETRSGSVSATLSHAAPEIIGGKPASAQSDVYSLASVLFCALTGSAPFDRAGEESLAPLIARIATAEPPDLRERGVPDALAAVLERALVKEPETRFTTAAEFGEALQGAARAMGVPAPEVPVSDVVPVAGLFEFEVDRRSTPRLGTMQVGRKRDAPAETTTTTAATRRRRPALIRSAVAAVLVLALAGGGAAFAASRTDDTTNTANQAPRLVDPVAHSEGLDVGRRYEITDEGSAVGSTVRLTNTSGETSKLVWFEVIPSELASSLTEVEFSVQPDGALGDGLIAYWVLTMAPGGEQPLSWTTALPTSADPTAAYLRRVKRLMATETANAADLIAAKRTELAAATGASAEAPVDPGTATGGAVPGSLADGGGTAGGGSTGGGTAAGSNAGGSTGGGSTGGGSAVAPPAPAPVANRQPTVNAANQASNELDNVAVTFSGSDPDGDAVSISVSGLPPGLSASGGGVSGRISAQAASVTSHRSSIATQAFTVTVTATDARGASASTNVTWSVRDTHRTMPNYIDQFGCGGCGGLPDVAAISSPGFLRACDPNGNGDRIYRQGVAPGAVIAWGQSITYWYGWKTDCQNVAKGY